jgi:SAM-dependent methyltransferase
VSAHPGVEPFVRHHRRYDEWFEHHRMAYLSKLLALRALLPWRGRGLEIGVGTARFAAPLGVEFGIDPAPDMLGNARSRGVRVAAATAEALPFATAARSSRFARGAQRPDLTQARSPARERRTFSGTAATVCR